MTTPRLSLHGVVTGQPVMSNATINPFGSLVVSDDASMGETVTVAMSSPADGSLSNLGYGIYDPAGGVYMDTGSAAAVTSDLQGLVFTPAAGLVAPGQAVTTAFTVADSDTGGASVSNATTSVIATEVAHHFTTLDTTTGASTPGDGQVYSGPVAGLDWTLTDITSDSVNITAHVPNVFLRSGSGMDGLDVSQANGNNVLDGSTGSNFLTGGTGNDTFYMDNRGPTSPVFSTVVNFHSGDNVTVWGVNPTDFTMLKLDNQGAAGFTGLDLIFTAPGHINVSFVLAGYTSADLSDGKLSSFYGTTPDIPGLAGSQFLTIHGN